MCAQAIAGCADDYDILPLLDYSCGLCAHTCDAHTQGLLQHITAQVGLGRCAFAQLTHACGAVPLSSYRRLRKALASGENSAIAHVDHRFRQHWKRHSPVKYFWRENCTQPDPRGYLLDLGSARSFASQLRAFAENIILAKQTNRLFVLTGFVPALPQGVDSFHQQVEETASVFQSWSGLPLANASAAWVTLREFEELCLPRDSRPVEVRVFVSAGPKPNAAVERWHVGGPRTNHRIKTVPAWQISRYPWAAPIEQLRRLPLPRTRFVVDNVEGDPHVWHRRDGRFISSLPSGGASPLLITDGTSFGIKSGMVDDTIGALRWASDVEELAARIIHPMGASFYAVHWRRIANDQGTFAPGQGDLADIVAVIRATHNRSQRQSSQPCATTCGGRCAQTVYVAGVHLGSAEKLALENALGGDWRVHSAVLAGLGETTDRELMYRAEMAVCACACRFTGQEVSTWPHLVFLMRQGAVYGPDKTVCQQVTSPHRRRRI